MFAYIALGILLAELLHALSPTDNRTYNVKQYAPPRVYGITREDE